MVKILFIHERGGIGGAGNVLYSILSRLDRSKFKPIVVLGSKGILVEKISALNIKCYVCPMPELAPLTNKSGKFLVYTLIASLRNFCIILSLTRHLLYIIDSENPDIVYANSLIAQLAGSFAAKIRNKKLVWHVHNIQPPLLRQELFKLMVRWLPDKVIVVSEAVRNNIKTNTHSDSKICRIYNGINAETTNFAKDIRLNLYAELGIPDDCYIVATISSLRPWKGHEDFIKAAYLVKQKFAQCRFLIIGEEILNRERGYSEHLKALARRLGLERDIIFTGFREDVRTIMAISSIIVQPSNKPDPFPMVILEAMAAAKPIVASNIGGIPEMVEDGKTGLLIPPNEPEALAQAILKLLKDREDAERMGRAAFDLVKEKFTLEKFIRELEKVLTGV